MTVRALPTVDGYTMDERLREFRLLRPQTEGSMAFIPFDSPEGKKLLGKYECCQNFCKLLDEYIPDEEHDAKKYMDGAKKAWENNEPLIGTILETLSKDEAKHGKALKDIQMLVCKK